MSLNKITTEANKLIINGESVDCTNPVAAKELAKNLANVLDATFYGGVERPKPACFNTPPDAISRIQTGPFCDYTVTDDDLNERMELCGNVPGWYRNARFGSGVAAKYRSRPTLEPANSLGPLIATHHSMTPMKPIFGDELRATINAATEQMRAVQATWGRSMFHLVDSIFNANSSRFNTDEDDTDYIQKYHDSRNEIKNETPDNEVLSVLAEILTHRVSTATITGRFNDTKMHTTAESTFMIVKDTIVLPINETTTKLIDKWNRLRLLKCYWQLSTALLFNGIEPYIMPENRDTMGVITYANHYIINVYPAYFKSYTTPTTIGNFTIETPLDRYYNPYFSRALKIRYKNIVASMRRPLSVLNGLMFSQTVKLLVGQFRGNAELEFYDITGDSFGLLIDAVVEDKREEELLDLITEASDGNIVFPFGYKIVIYDTCTGEFSADDFDTSLCHWLLEHDEYNVIDGLPTENRSAAGSFLIAPPKELN